MKRNIILGILTCFVLWIGGFGYYIYTINSYEINTRASNAIAVIAGGERRIETASALLKAGYAPILYITGISGTGQFDNFFKENKINKAQIIFGIGGENIQEGSTKIANFINANGIKSIRIVSSYYNMPALLKYLSAKLIYQTNLIPHPVYPLKNNYFTVFKEYHKYLYQTINPK